MSAWVEQPTPTEDAASIYGYESWQIALDGKELT